MSNRLVHVAIAGLAISIISLSLASALGGSGFNPMRFRRPFDRELFWNGRWENRRTTGQVVDRELPWDADDSLEIDIPASVHYQPGPEAHVVVRGAPDVVDRIRMHHGKLSSDRQSWFESDTEAVDVTLSAPAIRRFSLNGSGDLTLQNIHQPELVVAVNGSGEARGEGEVEQADISVAGSGALKFKDLAVKHMRLRIAGSGMAQVNAQDDIDVNIAGSGTVRLTGRPGRVESRINGSGQIVEDQPSADVPR